LWPGQFVNVTLTLGVEANAVVAPNAAIQIGQNGPYVFVIKDDSTAELRLVRTSRLVGNRTVIADQHRLMDRSLDIAWTGHGVSSVADSGLLRRDVSVASPGRDGNSVHGKFRSYRSAQERCGLACRSPFASWAHAEIGAEP
jgi:hypothetical protein